MNKFVVLALFVLSNTPLMAQHRAQEGFKKMFLEYRKSIYTLKNTAYKYDSGKVNKQKLILSFFEARNKYKKLEFLLEYYAPTTCKLLNGPNLYKANEDEPSKPPVKPEGFQPLEEAIFAQKQVVKNELLFHTTRLTGHTDRIGHLVNGYTFEDMSLWAAARLQIIRILSLGITGFDSPIAKNSLSEAQESLKGLLWFFEFYNNKSDTYNKIKNLCNSAIEYLKKNNDFDTFDRMYFTKNFLQPLYSYSAQWQRELNISFNDAILPIQLSNDKIFDKQTFNSNFYNPNKYVKYKDEKLKIELGKMLFFDPIMSANNKRSCASCHLPQNAFTDNLKTNVSIDQSGTIERNTPTVINAALQPAYFYDGRSGSLEDQARNVVFSTSEMKSDLNAVCNVLKTSTEYKDRFASVYNAADSQYITPNNVLSAIAAYERTLLSFNSKVDKHINGEAAILNESEIRGYNLFMGKALCGTCHFAPVFSGLVPPSFLESEFEVLGVPQDPYSKQPKLDNDYGRNRLTNIPHQTASFKTPTVRNIALSAPYMHNGAYKTLEDVMNFYNKGGGKGIGIVLENQTLPFDKLNLTKKEIKDIISFMNALTDTSGLTSTPAKLPFIPGYENRKIGGEY